MPQTATNGNQKMNSPAAEEEEDQNEEEGAEAEAVLDITCDTAALRYLQDRSYPDGRSHSQREAAHPKAGIQLPARWPALQEANATVRRPEGACSGGTGGTMRHAHESLGHFGVQRCASLLMQRYFWKGMLTDLRQYIQSCPHCQAEDPKFPRHDVLHSLRPGSVLDRVGVDLMGPSPRSRSGMTYVLTAVERVDGSGVCNTVCVCTRPARPQLKQHSRLAGHFPWDHEGAQANPV